MSYKHAQYNTMQYKKHLDATFPKGSERLQRKTLILQVHILKGTKNKTKLRKHETLEKHVNLLRKQISFKSFYEDIC